MSGQEEFHQLAIVGGGPAGLSAASNASSEGLSVALIESEVELGGQARHSSRIENYLGFPSGITGPALMSRAKNQAEKFGTLFLLNSAVTKMTVEGKFHSLILSDSREVICRAVLISCGLQWRELEAHGVKELLGKGVYYGASMDDLSRYANQHVVIVGGANSAGQAAMYFAKSCHVTMVVRGDGIEGSMSEYLIDRINKNSNIKLLTHAHVTAAIGEGVLKAVMIQQKHTSFCLLCGAMFIFIGAEPRTQWLVGSCELDERGFVIAGDDKKSSCDGVFVAGDVRHGSTKRIAAGVGEGAHAVAMIHKYLGE